MAQTETSGGGRGRQMRYPTYPTYYGVKPNPTYGGRPSRYVPPSHATTTPNTKPRKR